MNKLIKCPRCNRWIEIQQVPTDKEGIKITCHHCRHIFRSNYPPYTTVNKEEFEEEKKFFKSVMYELNYYCEDKRRKGRILFPIIYFVTFATILLLVMFTNVEDFGSNIIYVYIAVILGLPYLVYHHHRYYVDIAKKKLLINLSGALIPYSFRALLVSLADEFSLAADVEKMRKERERWEVENFSKFFPSYDDILTLHLALFFIEVVYHRGSAAGEASFCEEGKGALGPIISRLNILAESIRKKYCQ